MSDLNIFVFNTIRTGMNSRRLCKRRCGRLSAPGHTRNGNRFDTCCKSCAMGWELAYGNPRHDDECGMRQEQEIRTHRQSNRRNEAAISSVASQDYLFRSRLCKFGCNNVAAPGFTRNGNPYDTCCKSCAKALGTPRSHDYHCMQQKSTHNRGRSTHRRQNGIQSRSRSRSRKRPCKFGCGNVSAPGRTRNGNRYDTCCKSCVSAEGNPRRHDLECRQREPLPIRLEESSIPRTRSDSNRIPRREFIDLTHKDLGQNGVGGHWKGKRSRNQLKEIGRETCEAMHNGEYHTTDGNRVIINHQSLVVSAKNTQKYTLKSIRSNFIRQFGRMNQHSSDAPVAYVQNKDCLDAARALKARGYNPVVLNMANSSKPCGGFVTGAAAQEESLCRSSTLSSALMNVIPFGNTQSLLDPKRNWSYPLDQRNGNRYTGGMVYSGSVLVFRGNEQLGCQFLKEPFDIGVITAALPVLGNEGINSTTGRYADYWVPIIERKIRAVLRLALLEGHDSFVASAWGCGAYGHPPRHHAEIWKRVLKERQFRGTFEGPIVFAILDDHNTGKRHNPQGNYHPFVEVFGNKSRKQWRNRSCSIM